MLQPILFLIGMALVAVFAAWIGFRIADMQARKRIKIFIVKVYAKGTRETFMGDTEYYLLLQDYTEVKEKNYRFHYSDKRAYYMPVSRNIYVSADVSGIYKASFYPASIGWQLNGLEEITPQAQKGEHA